jgi:hypothetical protein
VFHLLYVMVTEHPPGTRASVFEAALLSFAFFALGTAIALAPSTAPALDTGGLHVFRQQGGAVQLVDDGALACEGDLVQLVYDSNGARHGVIWSVDSRGVVSLHHPLSASGDTALQRDQTPLSFSWELDDAPGAERFYFVTSPRRLDPAKVVRQPAPRPAFVLQKATAAPGCAGLR